MKLPGGERGIVELAKLTDYCLNPEHPRGQHKARVFMAALGFGLTQAAELRDLLLEAARQQEATPGENDSYGQRYIIDFEAQGSIGKARVRSSWIVRTNEDFPRFVTCYVL